MLFEAAKHWGHPVAVPDLQDVKSQNTFPDNYLPVFRLFLRLYYYSHEHGTFVALPAMPWTIPGKIQDALDCLRSIDQGMSQPICPEM